MIQSYRGYFWKEHTFCAMTDLEIPKHKGENLQTRISNEQEITIEDPQSPFDRFVSSDEYVFDLKNMA